MSNSTPPPPPPPPPGEGYGEGGPVPPEPAPGYGQPPAAPEYGQQSYGQQPAPGYGSMPRSAPPGDGRAVLTARPKAMDNAVRLMQVGAGLSLLSLLLALFSRGTIRDAVKKANETATTKLTPDQVDAAVTFLMGAAIVAGLIGVGLWLWMASVNGKGRSWARIVATVLFVVETLLFLGGFAQPTPMLSRLVSLLVWLVGAAAIFFIWKKESSAYYAGMSRAKY